MSEDHLRVPLKCLEREGGYLIFRLDISGKDYVFRAGKTATVSISSANDGNFDLTRIFSIASRSDSRDELRFATIFREDSLFKKKLAGMKAGDILDISQPSGGFYLISDKEKPLIFITSGVGATPVISLLNEAAIEGRKQPICFIYLNRNVSDQLFSEEFKALEQGENSVKIVNVVSEYVLDNLPEVLSKDSLGRLSEGVDLSRAMIYVSGTPRFVYDARKILVQQGIGTASIKTEKFSGY